MIVLLLCVIIYVFILNFHLTNAAGGGPWAIVYFSLSDLHPLLQSLFLFMSDFTPSSSVIFFLFFF